MKKIVILCAAAVYAISCSLLDESPLDRGSADDIITSPENLYLSTLGPIYSRIGSDITGEGLSGTYRGVYDLCTFTTDEAIIPTRGGDWYDGGLWQRLYLHQWSTGEAPIKNAWTYLYKMAVMANQGLATLDSYRQLISEEEYSLYRAELRAVRALYYYYILDLFGNVPIVTSTEISLQDVAQSPRKEVFDFVTKELTEVLETLPDERSNAHGKWYGRVTRPVANFLLAKLALNAEVWAGGWTMTLGGRTMNQWELVEYFCDALAKEGYALEDDYAANFRVNNETSVENIFTIPCDKLQYAAQYQYLFRSHHYDHAAACGFSGENGASATLEVLEACGFGTEDEDPRFNINYWGGQTEDLDGKPIFTITGKPLIYKPLSVALDVSGTADEKFAGARMRKYERDPGGLKDGKLCDNDIVLFRYADALLMKAEALLRGGGDSVEALTLVNRVRARCGAKELDYIDLDTILDERLRELAWEGWRRQDLIRFGRYGKAWSFRPSLPRETESRYTDMFPIPADVLAENPLLSQNQGY